MAAGRPPGAAGGEMRRRIAELDWSRTPLGPRESWPGSLRTALGICLDSRHPMVIWWGPELVLLYNDAWMPILGPTKHPALGRPGAEVWPENWSIVGEQLGSVLRGDGATWSEDQLLPVDRFGYLEEGYFTYSYSPVHDEHDGVGGVFTAVTETTSRVLSERRLAALRDLGEVPGRASESAEAACVAAMAALAPHRADVPFALVYLIDADETCAELVAEHGLGSGRAVVPVAVPAAVPGERLGADIWAAATTRSVTTSTGLASAAPGLAAPGASPVGDAEVDTALAIPLTASGQDRVAGVLVVGTTPYRALDEEYRSFLGLVGGQVATAVADARAYEEEHRRAEGLAELDRAKTEFFTGVSHELRTPLTLIAGPLQDALSDTEHPLPEPQRERLELVRRNSGRLRRLVDTMLDFARLEGGRLEPDLVPTDLARLTRGLAESFAPAAQRSGLEFVLDVPDLGTAVLVDPDMWEKIVLNLLSNAVKYTLHGTVRVRLTARGDGTIALAVADTGIGIPEVDAPRVFERFHRVRGGGRSVEGSGIGLALVAELVDLHRGEVRVDTVLGRGSTFTVVLPASARTEQPAAETRSSSVELFLDEALQWGENRPGAPARVDTGSTAGASIVVAEDNADLRGFVAGLLRPHYAVHTAVDGEEALSLARTHRPDLVLADVMMPRRDGFALLTALRAHPSTASVPVILLSARAGEEAAIEGLAAGADDYLTKPFSSHDLLARVRSTIELARLRNHEATWRRALVDSLQDAFYVFDADADAIVEINPALTDLLGLRTEDLPCAAPLPFWATDAEAPDDRDRAESAYRNALVAGSGTVVVPVRHVRSRRRLWASVSFSSLLDPRGRQLFVVTMRDVSAQRWAAARDGLLAEAGRVLSDGGDQRDRLERFVRTATPLFDGLVMISLLAPDGRLDPVAAAHGTRPEIAEQVQRLPPHRIPAELAERYATGRAFVLNELDDALVRAYSSDAADAARRRALGTDSGLTSGLVVPLVVSGRLLGSLAFSAGDAPLHADQQEIALATELGRRVAVSIESERLAERERLLRTITGALAGAGSLDEAARALCVALRDAVGASGVSIYTLEPDGEHLALVHSTGYPAETVQRYRRVRLDAPIPVAEAVRTGRPLWLGDILPTTASSAELAAAVTVTANRAAVALPLVAGGRIIAAMTASFPTPRTFPQDERDFVETAGSQTAQAFERAALADHRWQLAQTLQRALLPAALPTVDGLLLATRYRPAVDDTQAGGDWYDLYTLDDGEVALVVGDVVGQGPAAAAIMGQLRSALGAYLTSGMSPGPALDHLNDYSLLVPGSRGSTAICVVLDTGTGELRWASAGHVPPLLVDPRADGAGYLTGGEGALLGLRERPPTPEGTHRVAPGSTLVLYTDGLVERRGEVVDDGMDRLAARAGRAGHLLPDHFADAVLSDGATDGASADDVAVVVARISAAPLVLHHPATPEVLRQVRRSIEDWARESGLDEEVLYDVQLAVVEAVTNVVEHAYRDTAPGGFSCSVHLGSDGYLRVRVQDSGRWHPPPGEPGHRGRGLDLIRGLAADLDVDSSATGTVVSFRLRVG